MVAPAVPVKVSIALPPGTIDVVPEIEAVGSGLTVIVNIEVSAKQLLETKYEIVVVPVVKPETTPALLTEATAGVDVDHEPPIVPVVDRASVLPTHTEEPPVNEPAVIAGTTVTVAEPVIVPK
jgi:hypothetical protein